MRSKWEKYFDDFSNFKDKMEAKQLLMEGSKRRIKQIRKKC